MRENRIKSPEARLIDINRVQDLSSFRRDEPSVLGKTGDGNLLRYTGQQNIWISTSSPNELKVGIKQGCRQSTVGCRRTCVGRNPSCNTFQTTGTTGSRSRGSGVDDKRVFDVSSKFFGEL